MVTLNLEKIFSPKSVVVIGASDEVGSVGYALMKNFLDLNFEGKIYPVNVRKTEILGMKTYANVAQVPEPIDLAIIATPSRTVPDVLEQCGKAGIFGVIIISAGFKEIGPEGAALEEKIVEVRKIGRAHV